MIEKIKGVIKEFEWGTQDFLPNLFGYDAEGAPQAEAWFGTHPMGEALTSNGTRLSDVIKNDPETLLGKRNMALFGNVLPLLLKVLSFRTPLSIQCHPDKQTAKDGYRRETALRDKGVSTQDLDYKDAKQKAEVLYALTPVTAMCGFRSYEEIVRNLRHIIPVSYEKYLSGEEDIQSLFSRLQRLDKEDLSSLINELVADEEMEKGSDDPRYLSEKEIVIRSYRLYGADPGVLAPYLMNIVRLLPGEALFLRPRTLHSYIFGNGIELMSLSDNVLHGGLTRKKIDIDELLKVMDPSHLEVRRCKEEEDLFSRTRIITDSDEFALYILKSGSYTITEKTPSLVLAVNKGCHIVRGNTEVVLDQGECAFISADEDNYTIKSEELTVQASVPVEE